jgi:hypothetical protein
MLGLVHIMLVRAPPRVAIGLIAFFALVLQGNIHSQSRRLFSGSMSRFLVDRDCPDACGSLPWSTQIDGTRINQYR